ncbi:glucan endo-1 3-beta-glucosidase-like [Prunus yedoensis var. nudiflora]|uniref:glucan endo-1,3-beta-D-glucosidase n=1 Tax=Prunus yedoensis var. nudiflora TaxID=2094558 RepID=A0A314UWE2_PRUYE|nr:glucan endo-1 3-beta-glucosidase-like [Prunus yedoensis var. nudiflora]
MWHTIGNPGIVHMQNSCWVNSYGLEVSEETSAVLMSIWVRVSVASPPQILTLPSLSSLTLNRFNSRSSGTNRNLLRPSSQQPPPPAAVLQILQTNNISSVRLFNTDPATLQSFSSTPTIRLTIGVPNELLPTLASATVHAALAWLQSNILAHIPPNQIHYLAVGNEVFLKDPYYIPTSFPPFSTSTKPSKP